MTRPEHNKWLRWYLKCARKDLKRRDYLSASDCFRSAAFHQARLKEIKRR